MWQNDPFVRSSQVEAFHWHNYSASYVKNCSGGDRMDSRVNADGSIVAKKTQNRRLGAPERKANYIEPTHRLKKMSLQFQYGMKNQNSAITGLKLQPKTSCRPSLLLVSCLGSDSLGILELVYREDHLIFEGGGQGIWNLKNEDRMG